MGKPGTWIGFLELRLLSKMLAKKIVVLTPHKGTRKLKHKKIFTYIHNRSAPGPPLIIKYHNSNHFQAVFLTKEGDNCAGLCPESNGEPAYGDKLNNIVNIDSDDKSDRDYIEDNDDIVDRSDCKPDVDTDEEGDNCAGLSPESNVEPAYGDKLNDIVNSDSDDKSDRDYIVDNDDIDDRSDYKPYVDTDDDMEHTNVDTPDNSFAKTDDDDKDEHNETEKGYTEKKKRKKIKFKTKSINYYQPSWLSSIDVNGNKLNEYIRPFKGCKTAVVCCKCSKKINVLTTGKCAILRHAQSKKHIENMTNNEDVSRFFEKSVTAEQIEILISAWMITHNISFNAMSCLSHIIKMILRGFSCSRNKVGYLIQKVLSKTEMDAMFEELKSGPFSMALDSGTHGKQKRTIVLVRYFDQIVGDIVTRFLNLSNMNKETSENLFNLIIKTFKENDIPYVNCVQVLTDGCNVMQGVYNGLIPRLAQQFKTTKETNIGADPIHHLHNASKHAFQSAFPNVYQLLLDIKYDLCTSPSKCEDYQEVVLKMNLKPLKVPEFFPTRFLSSGECLDYVVEYFPALQAYYSRRQDTDNLELEDDSEFKTGSRITRLKKLFNEDLCPETYLQVVCAAFSLKPSVELLLKLQSEGIIIHKLDSLLGSHMRHALKSIVHVDITNKKTAELMNIIPESKNDMKNRKNGEEGTSKKFTYVRRIETCDFLLDSKLSKSISEIIGKFHLHSDKGKDYRAKARRFCLSFQFKYFINLQKYLRLDKTIFDDLSYLCPSKHKDSKAIGKIKKLANRIQPFLKEYEVDQVNL